VWICAARCERSLLPQRLTWPDLIERGGEALNFLGEQRSLLGLAPVEVLV
jgi:hypothetical protein